MEQVQPLMAELHGTLVFCGLSVRYWERRKLCRSAKAATPPER
jgi:hypothetical protein